MLLLLYFVLYFLLSFVWRSVLVYRRTGNNPFVLPKDDSAYGYVGRAFKMLIAMVGLTVALNAVHPQSFAELGSFALQDSNWSLVAGWFLLLASMLWLLLAQAQMGNSWRIGIDNKNATALVSHGLFALSRNPIFLAMRVNLLGLFLVLPNGLTFAILLAGEILMQVQVRLEEVHLSTLHREQYSVYCSRVRRWL